MKTFLASLMIAAVAPSSAQIVFSFTNSPIGVPSNVFQQASPGGAVTSINTGLAETNYASLSRDGRFITFSSPDPTGAVTQLLPSSDLYSFDRATGRTRKLVDFNSFVNQPQGVPMVNTFIPEFSARSPDGQFVVFSNRLTTRTGNAEPRRANNLTVANTSSGLFAAIEEGRGALHDFTFSEFVGMSWTPDSQSFVTSAYITIAPGNPNVPRRSASSVTPGRETARSPAPSSSPRPRLTRTFPARSRSSPAFSPSGRALAYFDIFFPDAALLRAPAFARLIVADANGSTVRAQFAQGNYPLGVTWSADGNQLIFSIAPQTQESGSFPASGVPSQANVRATASFGNDFSINPLPGISGGFLPQFQLSTPVIGLSKISASTNNGIIEDGATTSFEPVKVGKKSKAKTITLTNTSMENLKDLNFSASGKGKGDFVISRPSEKSLAPGAVTKLKITFKPKSKGTKSATLNIKSNSSDKNLITIKLTGKAKK
ncbi:MAG: choice-of-anchor D domain-containing protein [Akkermansiaceae bacterium]|nr:choice-of-anchor D domain-containing protein [Akkermansiaceae bacterium]